MIKTYIDGSSKGNPGPSGIGIAIYDNATLEAMYGIPIGHKTNNQAEFEALRFALMRLQELEFPSGMKFNHGDVEILTDSKLVIGMFSQKWKATTNIPLINEIKELLSEFKEVIFTKVKAHSGIESNVLVDRLAQEAATTQKEVLDKTRS